MADYSPYGQDYYLDETGRKDSAKFVLNQLYEATGVPAFKRYRQAVVNGDSSAVGTLNRNTALVEALAGAVGLGSVSPMQLGISKTDLLKRVGKSFSQEIRAAKDVGYGDVGNVIKELKGRAKNISKEVGSAPEIFEPVGDFKLGEAHSVEADTGSIVLDPYSASKKALRHELYHTWRNAASDNYSQYLQDIDRAVVAADTLYDTPLQSVHHVMGEKFGDTIRKKYSDLIYEHGYHPEEIAAIAAEDIPLGSYKTVDNFKKVMDRLYKFGTKERDIRESTLYRLIRQNRKQ